MTPRIAPLAPDSIGDLAQVFCDDPSAEGCWCMWFIVPVKDYHAAGSKGNRAAMTKLVATSATPAGLVAYNGDAPVGWCAVGPRARYARAIKTPTYKGRDPSEDDDVWLVPCLYVKDEARGSGVTDKLLAAAVELARRHGATAIEGFPLTGNKKRSKDTQVGFEPIFSRLGFEVIRTPSDQRVVMRLDL